MPCFFTIAGIPSEDCLSDDDDDDGTKSKSCRPVQTPSQTSALGGIDSLYSIVQMPNGIPVATVAIGKAANAALLALRILSITDKKIAEALEGYHANMARESIRKTENLV